jgi:hypothetical protein
MRPLLALILLCVCAAAQAEQQPRWSEKAANEWYAKLPWLVGSNYIPATAINQLEMWQPDTFDPKRIDKELALAESLGMNTMRVFLHDLLWAQDPGGFEDRVARFLSIADKHGIRPIFVLFDSCWDPHPVLGKQRPPKPGVHNSGWVQSPGADALQDPKQTVRLEIYVEGILRAFSRDNRILAWDLWNEPDNPATDSYGVLELPGKEKYVLALLPKVFEWARSVHPRQPLTSGLWQGDWSSPEKLSAIERIQVENSDVISFHDYGPPEQFEKRVESLQRYHRPILCTEYMARGNQSTFQGTLPIAKKYHVAAYNWGFVAGKTQTWLPWDSWQKPYVDREPAVWFHEVFRTDGKPYRTEEIDFIRKMTGKKIAPPKPPKPAKKENKPDQEKQAVAPAA